MGRRRKKRSMMDYIRIPRFSLDLDEEVKKSVFILFVVILGMLGIFSIVDMAGVMGEHYKQFLLDWFGWGKWLPPVMLVFLAYALYDEERFELKKSNYLGLILFVIFFQSLLLLFVERESWELLLTTGSGGGKLGYFFADLMVTYIGFFPALLLSLGMIVVSVILMFDTTLYNLFGSESWFAKIMSPFSFVLRKVFGLRRKDNEEEEEEDEEVEEEEEEDDEEEDEEAEEGDEEEEEEEDEEDEEEVEETPYVTSKLLPEQEESIGPWWENQRNKNFKIPFSLLENKKGKASSGDIDHNKEVIRSTLESFGINVSMQGVSVGPTVTQYTFKPADGVKLSKITTLSNDLALALAAKSIRIEAPIPGKPLVGVEVPNDTKAMVGVREILASKAYRERKSNTYLALGKDVAGKACLSNLERMPHLLVAGTTNSGKSVCLNTIIASLMYQNTPNDLRFIMVDPKRVELTEYNDIPYQLCPVITDVPKTVNALKWCLGEMNKRFDLLQEEGAKNIQSYNETAETRMPYIVFIIDELADLMVAAAKEVEAPIIRLAQMSRAVGIHLILATQRPSVNIITGLIKANMPARIAFSVASNMDSRTILDTSGAEKLIGQGDMLFMNAEIPTPVRIQGAFLSDDEIKKIVNHVKKKGGKCNYLDGITGKKQVGLNGLTSMEVEDGDELLGEAKETAINMGKASASLFQRKFRIGYSRAANIIDTLEDQGVVGPANGSKPREVLISKEQYAAMLNQGVSGMSVHSREEAIAPDNYLGSEDEDEVPPVFSSEEDEEDEDDKEDVEDENEEENEDSDDNEDEEDDGEEDEENEEDDKDEEDEGEESEKNEEDEDDGKYFSK